MSTCIQQRKRESPTSKVISPRQIHRDKSMFVSILNVFQAVYAKINGDQKILKSLLLLKAVNHNLKKICQCSPVSVYWYNLLQIISVFLKTFLCVCIMDCPAETELSLVEYLLCVRQCAKCFPIIISLNLYKSEIQVLCSIFYR